VYIGPRAILIGDFGVCQSYTLDATFSCCNGTPTFFRIPAGGADFDVTACPYMTCSKPRSRRTRICSSRPMR